MTDYEAFVKTGRFTPVGVYLSAHPKAKVHPDCTDVIVYNYGYVIQALKTNEFYFKRGKRDVRHRTLDSTESALWYLFVEKVINTLK